jgi:hypothetical protein
MEPNMTKPDDALTRAVAELRAAAELVRRDRQPRLRAAKARRTKKVRAWDAARERFLEVAIPADRWYREWVQSGRLALILSARTDEPRDTIELPRLYLHDGAYVFDHEEPSVAEGRTSPNFTLSLGETLELGVFGRRSRWGGGGGTLARVHELAELAKPDAPKLPFFVADVEENFFAAATRFASLFRDDALEPLLARVVAEEAAFVRSRIARSEAARAVQRGEPGAHARIEAQLRASGWLQAVPVDASAEVRREVEEANDLMVRAAILEALDRDARDGEERE